MDPNLKMKIPRTAEHKCQDKRLDGYKHWPLVHYLSSGRCSDVNQELVHIDQYVKYIYVLIKNIIVS